MEAFLKSYYQNFAYKSIDSDTFKNYFLEYFSKNEAVKDIDWDTWFNSPGMPPYKPKFDDSLAKASWALAKLWQDWNPANVEIPFTGKELDKFSAGQTREFLTTLLNGEAVDVK